MPSSSHNGRRDSDRDIEQVAKAADALQIRLLDLFRNAYRLWYRRPPTDRELDRYIGAYLSSQEVPVWVRDYCRRVLQRHDAGDLDPREFGVEHPTAFVFATGERRWVYWVLLAAMALFLLLVA